MFLLTLNCLTELDLLEFKLCSFSSKFRTCEIHLWWRVMACILRSVGDLEGIKHSLLGGFQTSFNKPAVIQRTEGCIVALQPPLCAGGPWTSYQQEAQPHGWQTQVERVGADVGKGTLRGQWRMGQLCGRWWKEGEGERRRRMGREIKSNPKGQQKDSE